MGTSNIFVGGKELANYTSSNDKLSLTSSVAFPSGTMCGFTETTTTPTASQGTDTSYTTLTGSSVDYTPVAGSSFVVYQYSFVSSCKDNNPIISPSRSRST